jgi:hypothetical protein
VRYPRRANSAAILRGDIRRLRSSPSLGICPASATLARDRFLAISRRLELGDQRVFSNCAIAPKTCRTKIAVAAPKRLELLNKLIPTATAVAVLLNPSNPNGELTWRRLKPAAGALGMG